MHIWEYGYEEDILGKKKKERWTGIVKDQDSQGDIDQMSVDEVRKKNNYYVTGLTQVSLG